MDSTFYNFYKSIAAIKHIQRKGWLDIGINGVVDTIASHSFAATLIGWLIAKEENLNNEKIIKLLLIHDLIMAHINDYTPKDKEYLSKKEIENAAIAKLLKDIPEIIKAEFTSLISEYQEEKREEAVLARECDKIETLLQASMYSEKLAKDELSQFLSTYKEKIKSQIGLSILKDLEEEAKKYK